MKISTIPLGIAVVLLTAFAGLEQAVFAATHTVTFRSNQFTPAQLTVNVGDTVTFENQGGSHTVTGTGDDPFCGSQPVSESCSVTFSTPGTFPYRCIFHSSPPPNAQGMVGSITVVGGATNKPNLVPFHLNGWTAPMVVSREMGDNISDPDFYDDQDIFLDWAIANISLTAGITPRFFTELRINGESKFSWFHDGLAPDTFNKIEDYNIGKLPAADHIFTLVTDHTAVVDEADEADNAYELRVRVIPSIANKHTVLVSNNRYNPDSLTIRKGDTVDFRRLEGSHTVTGTGADPFCGGNAMPEVCSVTFNAAGTFPYRCVFHSSGPPNPAGMVGVIRVIDVIQVEKATRVQGPYLPDSQAVVDYSKQTVSFPLPQGSTFWRLNSNVPLRISKVETTLQTVVLSFGF